jgi:hypothetical protein
MDWAESGIRIVVAASVDVIPLSVQGFLQSPSGNGQAILHCAHSFSLTRDVRDRRDERDGPDGGGLVDSQLRASIVFPRSLVLLFIGWPG